MPKKYFILDVNHGKSGINAQLMEIADEACFVKAACELLNCTTLERCEVVLAGKSVDAWYDGNFLKKDGIDDSCCMIFKSSKGIVRHLLGRILLAGHQVKGDINSVPLSPDELMYSVMSDEVCLGVKGTRVIH